MAWIGKRMTLRCWRVIYLLSWVYFEIANGRLTRVMIGMLTVLITH